MTQIIGKQIAIKLWNIFPTLIKKLREIYCALNAISDIAMPAARLATAKNSSWENVTAKDTYNICIKIVKDGGTNENN